MIDAPRFTMLETVRDYAREKLEAGGLATRGRRGAPGVGARARRARRAQALTGVEHDEWLERLELESGNIRVGRVAGVRRRRPGDARARRLPAVAVVVGRHHTREARLWLERALDFIDTLDDAHHRAAGVGPRGCGGRAGGQRGGGVAAVSSNRAVHRTGRPRRPGAVQVHRRVARAPVGRAGPRDRAAHLRRGGPASVGERLRRVHLLEHDGGVPRPAGTVPGG